MAGMLVGGPQAWKVRRHGDFVAAFHWMGVSGEEPEPTLVLFPARPALGAGAFCLGLSSAWKYADSTTGAPTPYLIQMLPVAAKTMGITPTTFALRKIADIIVDSIPDLVVMPPEPTELEKARKQREGKAGEATLRVDNEVVFEGTI